MIESTKMPLGKVFAKAGLAATLFCTITPVHAAIVEKIQVLNSFAYFFDTGFPGLDQAGDRNQSFLSLPQNSGSFAQLGVDFVGEVNANSFYFLHNDYCVGICSTASRTEIRFTLTNTGPNPESLRFDSLITPGHLAKIGANPGRAGFSFDVRQTLGNIQTLLYQATGLVDFDSISVITSDDRAFNGLNRIDTAYGTVLDWGATNLNLNLLTIGPGQTSYLTYSAQYSAETGDDCRDLRNCSGIQVVFGDPRQNGTGANRMAMAAFFDDPVRDIINRDYGEFIAPVEIVKASAPLPPPEPLPAPLIYGGPYTPIAAAGVPEPGTWMLLILGFGLVGARMRGRRRSGIGHAPRPGTVGLVTKPAR